MTKAKAIFQKCLECSGDSSKEVSLCHILSCSLWAYRCGYSMRDKRFWTRMQNARRNYPKEFVELLDLIPDYLKTLPNTPETALITEFYSKACHPESLASLQTASNQKQDTSVHSDHRESLDKGLIRAEEEK